MSSPAHAAASSASRRRWWRWLLLTLAFLPAFRMAETVASHVVNIACWDMWENAPLLEKWHSGTLAWSDLYAAQIQHRIVVPRLLIIALHTLSGGDFRWENWLTFAVFLAVSVMLWRQLRRTLGAGSGWVAGLLFVANLLVFSPLLYQNLFWGSSMWMALPLPMLLAALLVLQQEKWAFWLRIGLAALLAELATHSFAHGLCTWPVLVVYVAAQPTLGPQKRRLLAAGGLVLLAAATFAAYFHNFVNQAYHAYNLKVGESALGGGMAGSGERVVSVFLGLLGAPFSRDPFTPQPPMEVAPRLGLWLLAAFVLVAASFVVTRRGRTAWRTALPWLALASYVIGVALMIGFGRSQTGEFRAVTPRYLVVSLHLWIATGVLVFLAVRTWLAGRSPAAVEIGRRVAIAALAVAAMSQLPVWRYGLHLTDVWSRARWQALAQSMFIEHFRWEQGTATQNVLDKSQDYCREAIRTLRRIGKYKTPVLAEPDLSAFTPEKKRLAPERAGVTSIERAPDGRWRLSGHARFGLERPADLVLLALPPAEGRHRVIALGQMKSTPALRLYGLDYEFANADPLPHTLWSRWEAYLPADATPPAGSVLELWALDAEGMKVTRFEQDVHISPSGAPEVVAPAPSK